MANKFLIPDREIERKTQADVFSTYGTAFLLFAFSSVFMMPFFAMMNRMFDIVSSIFINHMIEISILIMMTPILLWGVLCFRSNEKYMTAYAILPDKIVKGRIMNKALDVNIKDLGVDAAVVMYELTQLFNSTNFWAAHSLNQHRKMNQLEKLNTNMTFVEHFFFTDAYQKSEYYNPRLIKETKRYYLYQCDGIENLKIYKMYTGMDKNLEHKKGRSILLRALPKTFLMILAVMLFFMADFVFALATNKPKLNAISHKYAEINTGLSEFGYIANEQYHEFVKKVGERDSYIRCLFDSNTNLKELDFELAFNSDCNREEMVREITYLCNLVNDISNTDHEITTKQIDELIQAVNIYLDSGEFSYYKIKTGEFTIGVGSYLGYAEIKDY